jgi:hypothetical protein
MIGTGGKRGDDFSAGLYMVGGSLVVSAIVIVALRFIVEKPKSNIAVSGAQ